MLVDFDSPEDLSLIFTLVGLMIRIMKFLSILLLISSAPHAFANDNWNQTNDPANLNAGYNYNFDQLPLSGSVDPAHTPWSDNYWESDWGGISLRWNTLTVEQRDPDLFAYTSVNKEALFSYVPPSLEQLRTMSRDDLINLSPAEKYDILMGHYDYPTVYAERSLTSPDMKDWQGICHGWVPAAINVAEPQPIDATNADGVVIPFGSSDVKGLLSYYYGVTAYSYARGSRTVVRDGSNMQVLDQVDSFDPFNWINLVANAVIWNSNGRLANVDDSVDSAQCADPKFASAYGSLEKCIESFSFGGTVDSLNLVEQVGARSSKNDPNPGAFFVVLANQLGLMHQAFAANLNRSGHGDQIWNQPVSSYSTTVDYDKRKNNGGNVGLTTTLTYVSEIPQTFTAVVGTPTERFETMVFSYELDIDDNGNVTGGKWKHGTHPSFLWTHAKLPIRGYFSKLKSLFHS
jgi:hypothetical protein